MIPDVRRALLDVEDCPSRIAQFRRKNRQAELISGGAGCRLNGSRPRAAATGSLALPDRNTLREERGHSLAEIATAVRQPDEVFALGAEPGDDAPDRLLADLQRDRRE